MDRRTPSAHYFFTDALTGFCSICNRIVKPMTNEFGEEKAVTLPAGSGGFLAAIEKGEFAITQRAPLEFLYDDAFLNTPR